MRRYILILALAAPLSAAAQFFDHFDGDRLAGHWNFFSEFGERMEYQLSDSMLHVTRVYGGPRVLNRVEIYASVGPYPDYEVVSTLGWDEGEHQALGIAIYNGPPPFGFSHGGISFKRLPGQEPVIIAGFSGGGGTSQIPAPQSGMHELRVTRAGDLMTAYFNGEIVHQARVDLGQARYVTLLFGAPDSPAFAPLHVDMVRVVPEPATFVILGIGAICAMLRRRR